MKDYEEKSNQIRQLAGKPAGELIDHLSSLHQGLEAHAPNIVPHIQAAAANAISFLNSKLPAGGNELIQDAPPQVSKAHKQAWLDLHKTVDNPVSVLEHVNRGTLNKHHLEALTAVYPDLHQEMVQKIQEQLGNAKAKGKSLPYQKRVAISKFIGQPLDSTMTSQSMQAIMGAASQNKGPAATAQKQKSASSAALGQINKVTSLYRTPAQAAEVKKGS